MTRYTNSLEGGTNGTTITVANSGGASGTAFTAVTAGTLTFSNSSACVAHGSLGMLTSSTAAAGYVRNAISATSFAARLYAIFPATIGAVDEYVIRFQVSGTRVLSIHVNTAAKLRVVNGAGTNVWTATNAVTSGTLYRIELRGIAGSTTSNGTIEAAYYLGDSTTAVESYLADATANVGTVAMTDVLMGKYSSNAYQIGFDELAWDDAATALIGPVNTNVAPSLSLSSSTSTLHPGETATITATASDSDGTVVSLAWSTAAGALSGSGSTRTLTAPASLTDQTATVQVIATDDDGATTTQTTDVALKASMSKLYNGTAWVPIIERIVT